MIERFIDANNAGIPDYAKDIAANLAISYSVIFRSEYRYD